MNCSTLSLAQILIFCTAAAPFRRRPIRNKPFEWLNGQVEKQSHHSPSRAMELNKEKGHDGYWRMKLKSHINQVKQQKYTRSAGHVDFFLSCDSGGKLPLCDQVTRQPQLMSTKGEWRDVILAGLSARIVPGGQCRPM
jgi:hypothetical protein